MRRLNWKLIGSWVVVFILGGLFTHYVVFDPHSTEPKLIKVSFGESQNYKYTQPLLGVEIGDKNDFSEYKSLENKINALIQNDKDASTASFYYRDLSTGRWTGINEQETFSPGSLLKVPLMIAYYKMAESSPNFLSNKLIDNNTQDYNAPEIIKPKESLVPGQSYTIDDLISRMIVGSDNNATNVLFNNMDNKFLNEVYSDLGITFPETSADTQDFVSTKEYGVIFRALFNSTYLDPAYSEKALGLMTHVEFNSGIVKGIPDSNILVAHKFGERDEVGDTLTIYELHDCGIVYYPKHPYLLCVMTRGDSIDHMEQLIEQISSTVYDTVKNEK